LRPARILRDHDLEFNNFFNIDNQQKSNVATIRERGTKQPTANNQFQVPPFAPFHQVSFPANLPPVKSGILSVLPHYAPYFWRRRPPVQERSPTTARSPPRWAWPIWTLRTAARCCRGMRHAPK
jgi:hypothetical protein